MVRGKDDDIYYKLVKELDSLIPGFVKVPVRKDELEILSENVWVIETDENQGTGFLVAGVGMITASHVLGQSDGEIIAISSDRSIRLPAVVVARDKSYDLAILDVGLPSERGFELSSVEPKLRLPITLLGFPNNNYGDSIQVRLGHVSGFRKDRNSDAKLILLSASVIEGNSGGPVLDKNSRVIAVALRGARNEAEGQSTEFHAAMPISALQSLILATVDGSP